LFCSEIPYRIRHPPSFPSTQSIATLPAAQLGRPTIAVLIAMIAMHSGHLQLWRPFAQLILVLVLVPVLAVLLLALAPTC
jgi:hypothetical protein